MKYHIARDGHQIGILSDLDVASQIRTGELRVTDLCWTEGMGEWRPLGGMDEFSQSLGVRRPASPIPTVAPATRGQVGVGESDADPYAPPRPVMGPGRTSRVQLPAPQFASVLERIRYTYNLGAPTGTSHTLSSGRRRLGAFLLDFVMAAVAVGPIVAAFVMVLEAIRIAGGPEKVKDVPEAASMLALLGFTAFAVLQICNAYLLTTRGQSLGKLWMKIRIVSASDLGNPGFLRAVLLRTWISNFLGNTLPGFVVLDAGFIFADDRRCLHDKLADTIVVDVE